MAGEPEATQLIYLRIPPSVAINPPRAENNGEFQQLLQLLKAQPGFRRMYWGRRPEVPDLVQLHVVRETLQQHYEFLKSPAFTDFQQLTGRLTQREPTTRHALIHEYSKDCPALGKGAPVTGTAIYLGATPEWDAAYAEWATIVPAVPGFMGISGGYFEEPVDGKRAYIALVGWENTHVHDAYHLTRHFRRNAGVLRRGHSGYDEYGHIAFRYHL